MEFFISEQQLRTLIHESNQSNFNNYMKELYSSMVNTLNNVKNKYNLNLKLLLTWGASVGGLVLPLKNYIEKNNFDITESQKELLLVGLASILFYDNKRLFNKVYTKIKEEGITEVFQKTLKKAKRLKEAFIGFMESLNVSITSVSELISYAFLIPIIADIQELTTSNDLEKVALIVAKRLFASGVILVSSEALTNVIKKILERVK